MTSKTFSTTEKLLSEWPSVHFSKHLRLTTKGGFLGGSKFLCTIKLLAIGLAGLFAALCNKGYAATPSSSSSIGGSFLTASGGISSRAENGGEKHLFGELLFLSQMKDGALRAEVDFEKLLKFRGFSFLWDGYSVYSRIQFSWLVGGELRPAADLQCVFHYDSWNELFHTQLIGENKSYSSKRADFLSESCFQHTTSPLSDEIGPVLFVNIEIDPVSSRTSEALKEDVENSGHGLLSPLFSFFHNETPFLKRRSIKVALNREGRKLSFLAPASDSY